MIQLPEISVDDLDLIVLLFDNWAMESYFSDNKLEEDFYSMYSLFHKSS
jgi:hypothetical protein